MENGYILFAELLNLYCKDKISLDEFYKLQNLLNKILEEKYKNENQELKNQQKEFIEWLENESKNLIRDAGYHQRICLEILSKYKEIIGDKYE